MWPSTDSGRIWLHHGIERDIPSFIVTMTCASCGNYIVTPAISKAITAALDVDHPAGEDLVSFERRVPVRVASCEMLMHGYGGERLFTLDNGELMMAAVDMWEEDFVDTNGQIVRLVRVSNMQSSVEEVKKLKGQIT